MELSFKEYLDNKEKLRQAINKQPKQVLNYKALKYCKLPVLLDGDRVDVDVRPGYFISITWLYTGTEDKDPTPILLTLDIDSVEETVLPFWKKAKFVGWVEKNMIQNF